MFNNSSDPLLMTEAGLGPKFDTLLSCYKWYLQNKTASYDKTHEACSLEENFGQYYSARSTADTILWVLGFLVIFPNAAVLCGIIGSRELHRPFYMYLANLAMSDLLAGFGLLYRTIGNLLGYSLKYGFIVSYGSFMIFTQIISASALSLLSVNSYVAVRHPTFFKTHSGSAKRNAGLALASSWIGFSLLTFSPSMGWNCIDMQTLNTGNCVSYYPIAYVVLCASISFCLFSILLFTNISVYIALQERGKRNLGQRGVPPALRENNPGHSTEGVPQALEENKPRHSKQGMPEAPGENNPGRNRQRVLPALGENNHRHNRQGMSLALGENHLGHSKQTVPEALGQSNPGHSRQGVFLARGENNPRQNRQRLLPALGENIPRWSRRRVLPALGENNPGHSRQTVLPALGETNPGHNRQMVLPALGENNPGHSRQTVLPAMGETNPGHNRQRVLPALGETNPGHSRQAVPEALRKNNPMLSRQGVLLALVESTVSPRHNNQGVPRATGENDHGHSKQRESRALGENNPGHSRLQPSNAAQDKVGMKFEKIAHKARTFMIHVVVAIVCWLLAILIWGVCRIVPGVCPRNGVPVFSTICLNSVINPVATIVRTPDLRTTIWKKLSAVLHVVVTTIRGNPQEE